MSNRSHLRCLSADFVTHNECHLSSKLLYGRTNASVPDDAANSLYRGFENSFLQSRKQQEKHTVQPNIDTKWSTVGEGFCDLDAGLSSVKDEKHSHSRHAGKRSRPGKRKLSEASVTSDLQNHAKYWTDGETDELSAEISCLSSSESESELTSDTVQVSKGKNSGVKKTKRKLSKPVSRHTPSRPSQKSTAQCGEIGTDPVLRLSPPFLPNDDCMRKSDDNERLDCISSYDSDNEEISTGSGSQAKNHRCSQEASDEISVLSSKSSTPKVSPSQGTNKMKAGDWLKNIQWQGGSPTKSHPSNEPENLEDSAKKKKKYSRCSMAEQLSRLQSREKSAQTVWYHKAKELQSTAPSASQDSCKSVRVRVMSLTASCSLCVARCTQLTDDDVTTQPVVTAMFPQSSAQSQKLKEGVIVKVLPPWQTLDIPALGHHVILCTYFTVPNPVPSDTHPLTSHKALADTNAVTVCTATWKCPCTQDDRVRPQNCPFQLQQCPTSLLSYNQPADSGVPAGDGPTGRSSNLHTVVASQRPGVNLPDSILDSIEKTGHCTNIGLSFQATIQRVFCKRQVKPPELSWSILVEDSHGVFALTELPDYTSRLDHWKDVLSWEGQKILLTDVMLLSRTNRDRDPGLFSVLDRVWGQSSQPALECSTDDSSSQLEALPRPSPGFCYLMKAWHERTGVKLSRDLSVMSDSVSEVKPNQLKDILNSSKVNPPCDDRGSFLLKVLYIDYVCKTDRKPCDNCSRIIYVIDQSVCCDSSGSSPTPPLYVTQQCELVNVQLASSDIIFVRDVYVYNGKLRADEYTRAVKIGGGDHESYPPLVPKGLKPDCQALQTRIVTPYPLTWNSDIGDLVTVMGKISQVNEEECYVWPECDRCGNGHLTSDPNTTTLICPACQSPVQSPVNRIKMEVCVECPELDTGEGQVMLQLHQSTVERLLPASESDEGYDISCVLQVAVGPLRCILRDKRTVLPTGTSTLKLQEVVISNGQPEANSSSDDT